MKKPKKLQERKSTDKDKDGLTAEDRINSNLLYTPELFTWTKDNDSKD